MISHTSYRRPVIPQRWVMLSSAVLIGLVLIALLIWVGQANAAPSGAPPGALVPPALPALAPALLTPTTQTVSDTCPLDVALVFDISGSMEYCTICYDCWVRTNNTDPDYPHNGYFNPIPSGVLASSLCSTTQVPKEEDTYKYLIAEAELAAFNPPLWETRYRRTGEGYWVIQRGSRNGDYGNRAGDPSRQSSNPCLVSDVDCTVPGNPSDDLCNDDAGSDVRVDCSAYVTHHPFATYGQSAPPAELLGRFYYLDDVIDNDPPPPKLEYDFVPDWSGDTYIWIRAQGGGDLATEMIYINPFIRNKSTIHWDVFSSSDPFDPQTNTDALGTNDWRDNRALPDNWRWIELGTTTATANESFVLRLWAGSPGYDIDKIIVTNDPRFATAVDPANGDYDPISVLEGYDAPATDIGPPATPGSATRAACDPCNPIYGLSVVPGDCTGFSPVLTPTNHLSGPLFGDVEPLRTSQEAAKRFIKRLTPESDQVGFVPFTTDVDRYDQAQLSCIKRDGQACYDPLVQTPPISYTNVLVRVEDNVATDGTDIAEGMRNALEVLGVNVCNRPECTGGQDPYADNCFDNSCSSNDHTSCGRGGAAKQLMIVLTDGSPNNNPGGCGNDPVYNFPLENDDDFDCVIYYAGKALESNVVVYTIGLGDGARGDLLEMAAETAGGEYFFAPTPDDLDAVFDEIISLVTSSCSPPNLVLTKSATPTEGLQAGGVLTYGLSFSNTGDLLATNVVLTDCLPINTQFLTATGSFIPSAPVPGDVITWHLDQLMGGATGTQQLAVVIYPAQPGETITNVAGLHGDQGGTQARLIVSFAPTAEVWSVYLPIILKVTQVSAQ